MESSSLKKAMECCKKQKHEVYVKQVRTGRGKQSRCWRKDGKGRKAEGEKE